MKTLVLVDHDNNSLGDATLAKYVAPLLRTIRAHVVLRLVQPYRRAASTTHRSKTAFR